MALQPVDGKKEPRTYSDLGRNKEDPTSIKNKGGKK